MVAVFFGFLVHRIVAFCLDDVSISSSADAELSLAQSVVCSHIVNGSPFGVDSVFEEGTRLYYYSTLSTSVKLESDTLAYLVQRGGYGPEVKLHCFYGRLPYDHCPKTSETG